MHRIITIAVLIVATVATAHADDRKRHESKRHESHNYIIERQQAGQVSGVPILRSISWVGDGHLRDGSMLRETTSKAYQAKLRPEMPRDSLPRVTPSRIEKFGYILTEK